MIKPIQTTISILSLLGVIFISILWDIAGLIPLVFFVPFVINGLYYQKIIIKKDSYVFDTVFYRKTYEKFLFKFADIEIRKKSMVVITTNKVKIKVLIKENSKTGLLAIINNSSSVNKKTYLINEIEKLSGIYC